MKHITKLIILSAIVLPKAGWAQCDPTQPQNIDVTVLSGPNHVQVCWDVQCSPLLCSNSASTSVLYYVGFYSQQSPAPNSLDLEYGFTTFVAPNCTHTVLWDGDTAGADTKESVCASFLYGQDSLPQQPGFDYSFSVEDICNNLYGYGAGTMCITIHEDYFCPGVTYDVKVWEVEVDALPNGAITSEDIACQNLYLDESAAGIEPSAFTFPGAISPIAAPEIIISGTCYGDGTYTGTHNTVQVICEDTVTFDYSVTPGCNITESVAAYANSRLIPNYGGGASHPIFWGQDVDDWFIFFANNIVDGQGNPIPYVGINQFFEFTVTQDHEVCIMAQDPCNGTAAITCVQFEVLDFPDPVASFDTIRFETCDSLVVDFINLSTNANRWVWDFGNGTFSTQENPTAVFTSPGFYTVTLTGSDTTTCRGRCTDLDQHTITVGFFPPVPDAVADFAFAPSGCDTLSVHFTNLSHGHVSSYWDFDNGLTSTDENPTTIYTSPGLYTVMLIALDTGLCMEPDTAYYQINFPGNQTVTSSFTASVSGASVQFSSTSVNCTDFEWDFGDGNGSTDEDPSHSYASPGQYTVTLICNNYCDKDTFTMTIAIVGMQDLIGDARVSLHPNPTDGTVWFNIEGGTHADLRVTLLNSVGQLLLSDMIRHKDNSTIRYDLSELPAGMYWFILEADNDRASFKVMKR